jgi:uncharacterized protein
VVCGVAALVAVSVVLALGLDASAGPGTLFDGSSSAAKATDRLHRAFGDEPVLVLVRTRKEGCPGGRDCRLTDLLLTPDVLRVLSLEGCLSGNIPRRAPKPAPVCEKFTESKPFQFVNGPGTFINESARQISARIRRQQRQSAIEVKQASEAARKIAAAKGLSQAEQERLAKQARQLAQLNALQPALRYGLNPQGAGVGDPSFVHQLVFEPSISFDAPKTRFAQYFPSRTSALIELRLRPGLSENEKRAAIDLAREAVRSPSFRLKSARYTVTGGPVAALGVASSISDALLVLSIASLIFFSIALALAFRARRGLLPLAPAAAAVAFTFGLMALFGANLTLASIAVLPVLAGVAVTVAVHFQRTGALPLAAALAAVIGFLVLVGSPVPMVRTFGAFVAIGIVLSLVVTLTLGSALSRGQVWTATPLARLSRLVAAVVRRPRPLLVVAAMVGVLGWVLAPPSDVASSLNRLAPNDVSEVKDLDALQRASGVDRGVSVLVTGKDLTDPRAIRWMVDYQRKALSRHGYTEEKPCPQAELCPTVLLSQLFGSGRLRSSAQARALLDRLPRYFTQGVISQDRRTANLSFLIRRMPIEKQKDVIDDLRLQLHPPAGVDAELAGSTVRAADAANLGPNGRMLALVALLGFALLMAAWRLQPLRAGGTSWRTGMAAVTVVAIAIAAGLALLLSRLGGSLDPMSATLGALAVGLCGYAALIFCGLYREGRADGNEPDAAVTRAHGLSVALLAFGPMAPIGFAILMFGDAQMLRDFGWIAALVLGTVLITLDLLLPAALVWEEHRKPVPRSRKEWADIGRAAGQKARGTIGTVSRPLRRRGEAQGP